MVEYVVTRLITSRTVHDSTSWKCERARRPAARSLSLPRRRDEVGIGVGMGVGGAAKWLYRRLKQSPTTRPDWLSSRMSQAQHHSLEGTAYALSFPCHDLHHSSVINTTLSSHPRLLASAVHFEAAATDLSSAWPHRASGNYSRALVTPTAPTFNLGQPNGTASARLCTAPQFARHQPESTPQNFTRAALSLHRFARALVSSTVTANVMRLPFLNRP